MNSSLFKVGAVISGAILLACTVQSASAHKGATGIVKTRMDAMKDVKTILKDIAPMIKAEKPFVAAQVKAAAVAIRAHAENIPKLFPKGSAKGKSTALPAIWLRWDEFAQSARQLALHAAGLDAASAANTPATSAAFSAIAKT